MTTKFTFAILLALTGTIQAVAQHGHFDVYLGRPTSGTQTVWGGIDVDDGDITPGLNVFESEMGEDPLNGVYLSIEPGFNNPGTGGPQAPGATAPDPGDTVNTTEVSATFDGATSTLFFWDGTGPVSLAPAVGVDFQIGNPTAVAAGDGAYDDHPFLALDDLDATAATFPTPGIYVSAFTAQLPGLDPTDTLYLVMGTEGLITADFLGIDQTEFDMLTDEQLDEALEGVIEVAVEYVEAALIPEPTALVLACGALAVAATRRRV